MGSTGNRSVAIVGLGRVGLPLGLYLAGRDCTVHGLDIDAARVETLSRGEFPFMEEGGEAALTRHLNKTFFPGTDYRVIEESEVIILTLGTPVDEHMNPVFEQLEKSVDALIPHLRQGQLLILRSTVSPGTTDLLARHLEREADFRVGENIFLAFCPERIAQGFSLSELAEIPQIVGGAEPRSTERAAEFWADHCNLVLPTRSRAAELAKLFTNMYRYVDFAIANEFLVIAETYDENVHEIVDLVNRDYKRGGLKRPGLTSGPCLFKDGFFLLSRVPFVELISVAWRLNESMPAYLIEQIRDRRELGGANVAILGLAFKPDMDDIRNSLSYKARRLFAAEGCHVRLHDPHVPSEDIETCVTDADVVFIAMNHSAFRNGALLPVLRRARPDAVICDIWNLLGHGTITSAESVLDAGK